METPSETPNFTGTSYMFFLTEEAANESIKKMTEIGWSLTVIRKYHKLDFGKMLPSKQRAVDGEKNE